MASVLSSLRYLVADLIGDDDADAPFLPDGLAELACPIVSDGIHLLVEYQGPSYARLYVDRVRRFVGRPRVDAAMLCQIAHLLAQRMAYEDVMRLAQLRLIGLELGMPHASLPDITRLRFDELAGALPESLADPLLTGLRQIGWLHRQVRMPFQARSRLGLRRLRTLAGLRRWRMFSVRYAEERAWVERWLHMIARALDKQPSAANAIIATATMIQGHGDPYRRGLADWHAIIDGLVKPTFDGTLPLQNLAACIAEARAAAVHDSHQVKLKRAIAQIRARALSPNPGTNAAE